MKVERIAGETHGPRCKGDAEPRVKTNLANESSSFTGTVFLQGIHCNSESPRVACFCLLSLRGERATAAQIEHSQSLHSPILTWHTARTTVIPKRFPDDQANGDKDGGQHPRRGRKVHKAGNCQLLSE